ncbi:MAG TPA: xanthine dehydrogenase family protein molybdopterin-binding subunit [Xanthobacteraceae bacterium]|nr:xanthine dehydrogenase family protein molybdopterin-binding subunit [Xanthobacteraceae bacterium]
MKNISSPAGSAKFGRIGDSIPRVEDQRLLTGRGCYTDDAEPSGFLHAAYVRSPHAHARIRRIDPTAALALPGVSVMTGADLEAAGVKPVLNPPESLGAGFPSFADDLVIPPWRALALGKVRHVGEAVALVIAPTESGARDAAEAVQVDYEPLASVIEIEDAEKPGAPLVWDEIRGNRLFAIEAGDRTATEAAFARAAAVVEIEAINNRVIINFMEPRSCIAAYDPGTARLSVQIGSQGVHQQAMRIAHALDLPLDRVRVTTGDVGGGFGARSTTYPEYIACAYAAYKLGRAIRWCASRSECFISDTQARDHATRAAMAFDRDGKILALRVHGRCNMGAHVVPRQPNSTVGNIIRMLVGAYAVPEAYLDFKGYVTNTIPINVYRGVGRFEDIYVVERLLDRAALRFGLDRAEIRRRNLVKPSAMPFTTPTGGICDCGDFPRLMESALRYAGWAGFPARKAEAAKRGRLRGIGVVYTIEGAGGIAQEYAIAEAKPDGTIVVGIGSQSQGQGHETTFAQLASETLDVPFDKVRIIAGDTDRIAHGVGTFASRSMVRAGSAAFEAMRLLIAEGRSRASAHLEAAVEDIVYSAGRFVVAGTDRSVGLDELAAVQPLSAEKLHRNEQVTWPNGCHVCEVEIDPETGQSVLVRYVAVDDVGRAVNPMIVHGQTMGAVAQGLGQALFEHCIYERGSGQLLSGSLMDYSLPRAEDLPDIETWLDDTPTRTNALGVKGAGEAGTVAAPCAAISAVLDALAPLGVTHLDMPATPARVWQAIQEASRQ